MDTEAILPDAEQWPISRAVWRRMVDAGILDGQRVELVHGRIVTMSPQSAAHVWALGVLTDWLVRGLPAAWRCAVQVPFAVGAASEPEPDVAVVPRAGRRHAIADRAALIIEVADSSLRYDRGTKAQLYASAGVPEYWIVNLRGRVVEIHTDPSGDVYAGLRTVDVHGTLSPSAFPELTLPVAELMPEEG